MGIAPTLAQYLLDREVAYELVPCPGKEASTGRPPAGGIVKSIVIRDGDRFMIALAPASRHIAFDKLRQLLGSNVNLANEEQVEELFVDCEPGCVPALGAAYGLPVVVDDSLLGDGDIYLEGSDRVDLIRLSGPSFRKLTQDSRHGTFTDARAAA